jgi:hypothetical protein
MLAFGVIEYTASPPLGHMYTDIIFAEDATGQGNDRQAT